MLGLAVSASLATADVTRGLTEFEHRLAATWKAGDCDAWGAMLSAEWSVIHVTGKVMTKAEALTLCRSSRPPIEANTVDELSVRSFGDAAVVTGRTTYTAAGVTTRLRFTDVFIRAAGRWQVVASHATKLEP